MPLGRLLPRSLISLMTRMPQAFNIMQLQLAVLIAFFAQHLASSTACRQLHAAQVH